MAKLGRPRNDEECLRVTLFASERQLQALDEWARLRSLKTRSAGIRAMLEEIADGLEAAPSRIDRLVTDLGWLGSSILQARELIRTALENHHMVWHDEATELLNRLDEI